MRTSTFVLAAALGLAGSPVFGATNEIRATYDTYAAGMQVAQMEAGFGIGPWNYQVRMAYRTTGLVGLFYSGHQFSEADGSWGASGPAPRAFSGMGVWHGQDRVIQIDYQQGRPVVRSLVPPNDNEREPVPESVQTNSVDTLSALVELIRRVGETGRCEAKVRTFDGRRASDITATTVGQEVLEPTGRSSYSGPALRCDFVGQMVAGFMHQDRSPADRKPLHGSAWLARVVPDGPPVPVRMEFQTRWFGDATMYLTSISTGAQAVASVR
jgi:hypothetical protein